MNEQRLFCFYQRERVFTGGEVTNRSSGKQRFSGLRNLTFSLLGSNDDVFQMPA